METTTAIPFNETKFRELLLYVASRLLGDPSYGSVKLNKVLFFSDFLHYATYGAPITGARYHKHPLGPAPRGLRHIQKDLIDTDQAALAEIGRGTQVQKKLIPLREPDLSAFTGTEIAMVESVLDTVDEWTAKELSEVSHLMLGWQVAHERQEIPYHSVFLYDGPVTEDDVLQAERLFEELRPELKRAGVVTMAPA